jgi:DNA invertase Pin-like site-specific DNA recombinase
MMRQLRGVFGEYEKTKLRERTMRGRREMALAGYISGGRVLFGYARLGKAQGKRGELVVVPGQAAIVKRIFRWADEGVKLLDIARRLTA